MVTDKLLYPVRIMQYYNNRALYQKPIDNPQFCVTQKNSLCGDELTLMGTIVHGRITSLSFSGNGCIVSQAAAAMLIEALDGKSVEHARNFSDEDMKNLFAVSVGPSRVACVLLAFQVLQQALCKLDHE